jgi:hypothetical protein
VTEINFRIYTKFLHATFECAANLLKSDDQVKVGCDTTFARWIDAVNGCYLWRSEVSPSQYVVGRTWLTMELRLSIVTWLILPVVICLSQRLSHACLSINTSIL